MFVQRCFTSTETLRTIRDGEPRSSQSSRVLFENVCFSVALRPQRPYGLPHTHTHPGRPPRFSTQLLNTENVQVQCCFTFTETLGTFRDGFYSGPELPFQNVALVGIISLAFTPTPVTASDSVYIVVSLLQHVNVLAL